jgi:hypothetical protein
MDSSAGSSIRTATRWSCGSLLEVSRLNRASWQRTLAAGAGLGIVGLILFGVIHALVIEPIWTRLLPGLLFAVPAGIATAWCFADLAGRRRDGGGWRYGLLFGTVIWLTLVPMTAFAAWLRVSGLRHHLGAADVPLMLAIAALTALAVGYGLGRNRRSAIAFAACIVSLVLAMAGPIPVTNGPRSFALFVAFLPLYLIAGLLLAAIIRGRRPRASLSVELS